MEIKKFFYRTVVNIFIVRLRTPKLCQVVIHLSLKGQLMHGRRACTLRHVSMFGDRVEERWNHMPKEGSQRILVD